MTPQRFSIILGSIIALMVVLGGVGYYFALNHLLAGTAQLRADLTESAQAQADLDALAVAKRTYDRDIKPIVPLVNGALPKTKQQTEILAQLQRLAAASGLTISGITLPSTTGLPTATSQTTKAGDVLALPLSFQLTGSYSQLQAFLTKAETLNRFTNVTTLAISRADPSRPITYGITLNAYIKP